MTKITALPTEIVRILQDGGPDAHGRMPERTVSDGGGNPCRHCLRYIPAGAGMLILAHRPFPEAQPYAETGPVFLCAEPCERHEGEALPEIFTRSPDYLIKGYGSDHRIVYGTGIVIPQAQMMAQAEAIFEDARVSYIHIRSARNNCYQARIDRG
ncbi:DUF1203 domain-containing protein [Leisingera methylohalidivorans]|uniref:DUF1203 domain-containing protein n=1 Tax=Leisingera methylohalidivorans DSM 14336 TaxID=999552 RepID=V9VYF2_9RHOB|nr:DUF1203 domain-containing protein [Leisingera methylohalidivorans]AHD02390.1 hypothetical protein METH_18785 [Leisingera methylohalidivorans DSM 14336]